MDGHLVWKSPKQVYQYVSSNAKDIKFTLLLDSTLPLEAWFEIIVNLDLMFVIIFMYFSQAGVIHTVYGEVFINGHPSSFLWGL